MKRFLSILISFLVIVSCILVIAPKAQAQHVYLGMYWIVGGIEDPDAKGTEGRQVVFYKEDPDAGYADGLAGTVGLSGRVDQYMLNAFKDWRLSVEPGTYRVAIVKGADGYGANPVEITVTGTGYDIAPNLVLAYGAGIEPPGPMPGAEPPPTIQVWFGNRLYQPAIYGLKEEGKKQFIVPESGKIKIIVDIEGIYQINPDASYAMSIRDPLGAVKSFNLNEVSGFKASGVGVKPLVIESPYPEELKAEEEEAVYTFTFNAASSGNFGPATQVATQAVVTVLGGPARLVDIPIIYPSPVRLKVDKKVTFQYTLSKDANIDIFLFDVSGRVVKRFIINAGEEGGSAGLNKVEWNLITDQGTLIASGIAVFTIVNRDDGKLLGRGKFTALP